MRLHVVVPSHKNNFRFYLYHRYSCPSVAVLVFVIIIIIIFSPQVLHPLVWLLITGFIKVIMSFINNYSWRLRISVRSTHPPQHP
jgi:hypothetical protein